MKQRYYVIMTISAGIVQARFIDKKYADQWLLENNWDNDGNCLDLYVIVKE